MVWFLSVYIKVYYAWTLIMIKLLFKMSYLKEIQFLISLDINPEAWIKRLCPKSPHKSSFLCPHGPSYCPFPPSSTYLPYFYKICRIGLPQLLLAIHGLWEGGWRKRALVSRFDSSVYSNLPMPFVSVQVCLVCMVSNSAGNSFQISHMRTLLYSSCL
jgi:hypothetical protein